MTAIAVLLLSGNHIASAQDYELNAIYTAVPFLNITPDSRAGAMGDVGVASSPDANSMQWNVGKFAMLESEGGVALSFTPWLAALNVNDISLSYLSGFFRLDKQQVIAGSMRYFSMGDITFTDIMGEPMGTYRPNEFAIDLGYSRLFTDNFSGGVAFRYTRSDLKVQVLSNGDDAKAGNSVAADLGFYYQDDVRVNGNDAQWAAGISISNIGSPMNYGVDSDNTPIPTNLRLGGRFTYELDDYNKISAEVDFNKLMVPTPPITETVDDSTYIIAGKPRPESTIGGMFQSFYDAPGLRNATTGEIGSTFREEIAEITTGFGLEYLYREQFAIRAGYFHEHYAKGNRKFFSMGVGIKLNVFFIDFSYLVPTAGRNSPLANTMRFTLGFNFADMKL